MKTPRAARDYGLPDLTVEEAARVLGISPATFMDWIAAKVKPSPQQWTNWNAPGATFPEALIRLYLTQAHGVALLRRRDQRRPAS